MIKAKNGIYVEKYNKSSYLFNKQPLTIYIP